MITFRNYHPHHPHHPHHCRHPSHFVLVWIIFLLSIIVASSSSFLLPYSSKSKKNAKTTKNPNPFLVRVIPSLSSSFMKDQQEEEEEEETNEDDVHVEVEVMNTNDNNYDNNDDINSLFFMEDSNNNNINEEDWIPDSTKARLYRETMMKPAEANPTIMTMTKEEEKKDQFMNSNQEKVEENKKDEDNSYSYSSVRKEWNKKKSVYTDEEEDLIALMGGKTMPSSSSSSNNNNHKREPGFLGDSTLTEISSDYQISVCYIADVLCSWGIPPPIDIHNMRLGDYVTGEQAFALIEAIHSLDIARVNDLYSNDNLLEVCENYDIELKDGFDYAVKMKWNLPFGVQTHLRVEQEDELLRMLSQVDFQP